MYDNLGTGMALGEQNSSQSEPSETNQPSISSHVEDKATHHDTHAIPPRFVQEAYSHYNKVKIADLNNDYSVVDFQRGLTASQQDVLKPIAVISAVAVTLACRQFSGKTIEQNDSTSNDVLVYEHQEFPGLQIAPGLLPPDTQCQFVSHILHDHLADPKHRVNLDTDYDIEYPPPSSASQSIGYSSFFKYAPTNTHSKPKNPDTHPSLNMVQFLSKKLRWLTIGEQYDWPTRSYKRDGPSTFPPDLSDLVAGLFPHIRSESGVCLLYGSKDYMPVHRDVSEQCERALASFSFGCDGIFLVARGEEEIDDPTEKAKRIVAIRVRSGDCVHMTGESRWAWHAMPRTISGTCPDHLAKWPVGTPGATAKEIKAYEKWKGFMGSKRLNVSCRQVWD